MMSDEPLTDEELAELASRARGWMSPDFDDLDAPRLGVALTELQAARVEIGRLREVIVLVAIRADDAIRNHELYEYGHPSEELTQIAALTVTALNPKRADDDPGH